MRFIATILSLLIAASGWYYAFYSKAAGRLSGVEGELANRRRVRLRRAGGCAMMALAVCFFAGFHTVDADYRPGTYLAVWLAVFGLLGLIVLLALIDLRLTMQLRQRREKKDDERTK